MEDVVVDAVATADVATADFIATADVASAKKAIEGGNDIAIANNYMADTGYIGENGINSNQDTNTRVEHNYTPDEVLKMVYFINTDNALELLKFDSSEVIVTYGKVEKEDNVDEEM